jgi:hypothetical protein
MCDICIHFLLQTSPLVGPLHIMHLIIYNQLVYHERAILRTVVQNPFGIFFRLFSESEKPLQRSNLKSHLL